MFYKHPEKFIRDIVTAPFFTTLACIVAVPIIRQQL